LRETIGKSRKIVIKIGSNTISDKNGKVNNDTMSSLVEQISTLISHGKQIIIVSSGAGVFGTAAINKWSRKEDINFKQALCAIGQVELMNAYKTMFQKHSIQVAQMLLTRDDFEDNNRTLNIRNTLFTLIDEGVVTVINENDSVSIEEIKIGDNDTLAALTANLWNADLLILLSDIDGVYDSNPKDNPNAKLIEEVYNTDELLEEIDSTGKSSFGTGGILTKISAAKRVNEYGIPMILTNGKKQDILLGLLAGEEKATIFYGKK